jgi:hypothetical protein
LGDLEQLLKVARIPRPYVLVGTSGAASSRRVTHLPIQTRSPAWSSSTPALPSSIRRARSSRRRDPNNPANVERREYLQLERDAWATRKRVGDIPVTVVSVQFSAAAINESPFPAERKAMRRNVERQRGWLVLSPRAKQIAAHTSHAVEEDDPDLVTDAISDVVEAAQ